MRVMYFWISLKWSIAKCVMKSEGPFENTYNGMGKMLHWIQDSCFMINLLSKLLVFKTLKFCSSFNYSTIHNETCYLITHLKRAGKTKMIILRYRFTNNYIDHVTPNVSQFYSTDSSVIP